MADRRLLCFGFLERSGDHVDAGKAVLEVEGLRTRFETRIGTVEAITDVEFRIDAGETVALVGESGSGKSVTALSILQLLEDTGDVVAGSIMFDGHGPDRRSPNGRCGRSGARTSR